jgi:YidC/Oxa1 family membrane protein insertase
MNSLLNPIAKPIAWVLAAFYSIIPNFGVAIIGLSLIWMILIAPLTLKSTRSMLAMQALQPEIKRLQDKHRNDKQAFAQAQMELFRERKVSPLSSCLPSILPLPVFIALFRVIDGLSHKSGSKPTPKFLNQHTAMYHAIVNSGGKINAFGLNLADGALSHHSSAFAALPFFVLLLIMIGTSYLQTSMMMNRNPAASQNPQMKYMKYLPLAFGVICIRFPAGVVLYYAVSNICRIGQQYAMYRWDPRVRALTSDEVREVEARTHDIDVEDAKRGYHLDGDDDVAPPRRQSFRELLADSRKPPSGGANPPAKGATPRAGASKATPAKPAPKERPGSVKANRNRNGQPARPARDVPRSNGKSPTTPSGAGAGTSGTNGSGKGAGGKNGSTGSSSNGTKANGAKTSGASGVTAAKTSGANGVSAAKTNGSNGTNGTKANGAQANGAKTNGATGAAGAKTNGAKTNGANGATGAAGAAGAKSTGTAGAADRNATAKSAATRAGASPPPRTRRRRRG